MTEHEIREIVKDEIKRAVDLLLSISYKTHNYGSLIGEIAYTTDEIVAEFMSRF